MADRRPTNSELRLRRAAAATSDPAERGILELFDEAADEQPDEDAPLARETDEHEN